VHTSSGTWLLPAWKPGEAAAAEQLLLEGPPFDPGEAGFSAHEAYVGEDRVYLVFEGEAARSKALDLARRYMSEAGALAGDRQRLTREDAGRQPDARCLYRDGRLRASRRRSLGSR
jgi:hypothetical protein